MAETYDFSEEALRTALTALGDTPEAVAEKLLELGCKGHRNNCGACPVAMYLLKVIPDAVSVRVDSDAVIERYVFTDVNFDRLDDVKVDTPDAVGCFIEQFDEGGFDDLVVVPHAA